MHKNGTPLDEIYNWGEDWRLLYYEVSNLVPEEALDGDEKRTQQLR